MIMCYLPVAWVDIHLLHKDISSCKDDHMTDITMHKATKYFYLFLFKYSRYREVFQTRIVNGNEVYLCYVPIF